LAPVANAVSVAVKVGSGIAELDRGDRNCGVRTRARECGNDSLRCCRSESAGGGWSPFHCELGFRSSLAYG
jgi:hypothetical protein